MENKLQIIQPEIFKKYENLNFGFSTIKGGISDPPYFLNLGLNTSDKNENIEQNRKLFFSYLNIPIDRINFQKQVHSDIVKYVESPGFSGECDAVWTDKKDIYLTISVADCVSVFLFEPVLNIIAGIHSGWKGTSLNIVGKTIDSIKTKYRNKILNFEVYIPPCISQKNFEVDKDVAELFNPEFVLFDEIKNKFLIDLKKNVISQIKSSGINILNLESSDLCTFENIDLLHSYRRDREKSGRMFGVIGIIS
ncbi:MAG TPA: peptidoglycan editing factor PgeF [Ignavibacteria bacterium]|nr:peptidoglycan editing factor PgeF [Ignavibacteria bacterium]